MNESFVFFFINKWSQNPFKKSFKQHETELRVRVTHQLLKHPNNMGHIDFY